jgi:hypothetical protein
MNNTFPAWGEILIGLIPALLMLAVVYAVLIVVCYLLYTALLALPQQHRRMDPGLVWLLLIPLFNLVWNFFVFLRVPESYQLLPQHRPPGCR